MRIKENRDFPQETLSNPMRGSDFQKSKVIQPHNYRRYFAFEKVGYNPTQPYSIKNYGSEHHFNDFYGCTIIIRKNKAEVINLWHQKQWRIIQAATEQEIDARIDEIARELEQRCVDAMRKFVDVNGGKSDFKPITIRKEEVGIHGIDFIDKIPKEMIIHDTVFKKVYNEKTEVFGINNVKNILTNNALNQFSPEIAGAIERMHKGILEAITGQQAVMCQFTQQIALHLEVLGGINKSFKKFNALLEQRKITEWGCKK